MLDFKISLWFEHGHFVDCLFVNSSFGRLSYGNHLRNISFRTMEKCVITFESMGRTFINKMYTNLPNNKMLNSSIDKWLTFFRLPLTFQQILPFSNVFIVRDRVLKYNGVRERKQQQKNN